MGTEGRVRAGHREEVRRVDTGRREIGGTGRSERGGHREEEKRWATGRRETCWHQEGHRWDLEE